VAVRFLLSLACAATQPPLLVEAPGSPVYVGPEPSAPVLADFDGNGTLDVVVVHAATGEVSVLLGDGRGRLRPRPGPRATTGIRDARWTATGDVNRDGRPDLAVASHEDAFKVAVWLGDGRGGFDPAPGSPVASRDSADPHTHGIALGDMNGDGALDLVTANAGRADFGFENSLSVLLGDGRGWFVPAQGSPFKIGRMPASLVTADLDGDHDLDVVTTNEASHDLSIVLGDGRGRATAAAPVPLAGQGMIPGDLDGDGDADIVVTTDDATRLRVLLGDGHGGFVPAPDPPLALGHQAWSLRIADMDRDGRMDVVAAGAPGHVSVFLGTGGGRLRAAPGSPWRTGRLPAVAVGDLDHDGRPDVVTANRETGDLTILLSHGMGRWQPLGEAAVKRTSAPSRAAAEQPPRCPAIGTAGSSGWSYSSRPADRRGTRVQGEPRSPRGRRSRPPRP